jgi:RNA polymerase sigma factor (sigma-70 family)
LFSPSDAALVRKTLTGQPQAFEALVLRSVKKAHAVARAVGLRGEAVEDAVQEGFLRAFRDLHSLQDPARFSPWLLAIVKNAARKQLGRRQDPSLTAAAVEDRAHHGEDLEGKDFQEYLWKRVAQLPEEVRDAVFLFYHEGESIRAVARSLAITVSGAKKRLRRGKDLLRERLWRELGECLRDMLPSTREWQRQAGKLTLLVVASLPGAWAARARAQPLEPMEASELAAGTGVSAGYQVTTILGGFLVSKKAASFSVLGLILLVALGAPLFFRSALDEGQRTSARRASAGSAVPAPGGEEPAAKTALARAPGDQGPAAPPLGRMLVVITGPDGLPVEGAEVTCTGPRTATARSGPEGTVSLVDCPTGTYALDIAAQGFGRERLEESIALGPEFEERIEIALTGACSIRGRVQDLAGNPVAGCEFEVYLRSSNLKGGVWSRTFRDSVVSDAEGEFRLEALPFGSYHSVEARKEGFRTRIGRRASNLLLASDQLSELSFDAGKELEVLVLVYRERRLEGTVTCRGRPVERAKILMDRKEADPELEEIFFSGLKPPDWSWTAPGAYEIRDCVPGTYEVEIRAPGMAKLLAGLEVPEPGVLDYVWRHDFQLEPGGTIRGWLVHHAQAAPGWVHLFRRIDIERVEFKASVRAGPDGLFSFPDPIEDGRYLLCGFAAGHPAGQLGHQKKFKTRALPGEVEVPVENGAGPLELVVESVPGDCGVSGRVLDRSGSPIPQASFHILFHTGGLELYGSARTASAGEFDFNGLPPGKLKLQVDATGFATAHVEASLEESGATARLEVVMEKARTFRARIEYADGEPDSDPQIVLERKTGEGWRHHHGGRPGVGLEGGIFEADSLPPGIYRVSATFREHAELSSPDVDLRESVSAEVVLRAESGVAVSGRISFADPELARGRVLAHLHYVDGVRAVKAMRIEGGAYRLEHLRFGRLADLVLQCEPDGEPILSDPLAGFAVGEDDTKVDLGPVRKRGDGK